MDLSYTLQLSNFILFKLQWSGVKMIGATFNCLAAIANCARKQDLPESKSILEKIESLVYEVVLPFGKSPCLQKLLENLV